jgi:hypothetical protein
VSRRQFRLSALTLVALAAAGCGAGGDATHIRATFSRFATDLERRDAAGACRQITPAFWSALGGELNAALPPAAGALPTSSCLAGLRHLFSVVGNGPLVSPGVSVIDISVHGAAATARQAVNGSGLTPMRFIKTQGGWELDCCTGRQLQRR